MNGWLIVAGLFVLALTWWDYQREEADTVLLLDWVWWWDFSRSEFPLIFWLLIAGQGIMGTVLILAGLLTH